MNCYLHEDVPAVAYCRSCGRALCGVCQRPAADTVFCQEHAPVVNPGAAGGYTAGAPGYANASNPYVQTPAAAVHTAPGLAFLLGFIPGVGAIYNGQYVKGLVHAIIFGLLISLLNSSHAGAGEPLLVMILMAFIFYMPFEAYHTAKKRGLGVHVEEWSSLMGPNKFVSRTPIGPIFLIVIGVLFLLDTLGLLEFRELARFWPVLLIVVGAFMLYSRVRTPVALPGSTVGTPIGTDYPITPAGTDYMEPRQ
jgi:hypothetical protein